MNITKDDKCSHNPSQLHLHPMVELTRLTLLFSNKFIAAHMCIAWFHQACSMLSITEEPNVSGHQSRCDNLVTVTITLTGILGVRKKLDFLANLFHVPNDATRGLHPTACTMRLCHTLVEQNLPKTFVLFMCNFCGFLNQFTVLGR